MVPNNQKSAGRLVTDPGPNAVDRFTPPTTATPTQSASVPSPRPRPFNQEWMRMVYVVERAIGVSSSTRQDLDVPLGTLSALTFRPAQVGRASPASSDDSWDMRTPHFPPMLVPTGSDSPPYDRVPALPTAQLNAQQAPRVYRARHMPLPSSSSPSPPPPHIEPHVVESHQIRWLDDNKPWYRSPEATQVGIRKSPGGSPVINERALASWSPRSIGERMTSRHNALYPQAGPSQERNSVPARSSSRLRHDANLADNLSRALVEVSMTYDDEENEEEEVQKYAGKGKRRV